MAIPAIAARLVTTLASGVRVAAADKSLQMLGQSLGGLSAKSRNAIGVTADLVGIVSDLGAIAGSTIPVMGRLAQGLGKALIAPLEAGIDAAKARAAEHIQAKSVGTTLQGSQGLANFFNVFTRDITQARVMSNASATAAGEISRKARLGDQKALATLELANVDGFDKKSGKVRDSAHVAAEALRQGEIFRRLADEAENKGNRKEADKYRRSEDAAFEIAGLSQGDRALIADRNISPGQMDALFRERQSIRPSSSDEELARARRVSEQWAEINDNFAAAGEAVGRIFDNFGMRIADGVMPPLLSFSEAVIKAGKWLGVIGETEQEKIDREKAETEQKLKDEAEFKNLSSKAETIPDTEKIYSDVENNKSNWMIKNRNSNITIPPVGEKSIEDIYKDGLAGPSAGGGDGLKNFDQLSGVHQMSLESSSAMQMAGQQFAYSNVGNNQSQTTVNMNVSANVPAEITSAAVQGANLASTISKQNNTSTAPMNAS